MRGKHDPKHKINHELVREHIETFKPCIPHYRREHAPNRRYLSSDICPKLMVADFTQKHFPISIGQYRKIIHEMNISFTKLGNEECEICKQQEEHAKVCDADDNNCHQCSGYIEHANRYREARVAYECDKLAEQEVNHVKIAADMQKVIILPRMDAFKVCVFTSRLIIFHETFAGLGKQPNFSVVWHEEIAGRCASEVANSYWAFLLKNRDATKITMWLDNCSGQNKNWTLFSMLVRAVNGPELAAKEVTLRYLEVGHTFNAADSVHGHVEKQMKAAGKVYDLNDLHQCISKANSTVQLLMYADILKWTNELSLHNLQKAGENRPILNKLAIIQFRRGSENIFWKDRHTDIEFKSTKFTKNSYSVDGSLPPSASLNRGITAEKKNEILKKLCPLMPQNRRPFWEKLTTSRVPDLQSRLC